MVSHFALSRCLADVTPLQLAAALEEEVEDLLPHLEGQDRQAVGDESSNHRENGLVGARSRAIDTFLELDAVRELGECLLRRQRARLHRRRRGRRHRRTRHSLLGQLLAKLSRAGVGEGSHVLVALEDRTELLLVHLLGLAASS